MLKFIYLLLLLILCNVSIAQKKFGISKGQTPAFVKQTNSYVDSVNKLNYTDTILKVCGNVNLEYYLLGNTLVKIIETSVGNRHIYSTQTYYFKNDSILFIYGDMEIGPESENYNILELRKIYFKNSRVSYYLLSSQKFYPDKLFKNDNDIERNSKGLRQRAKFIKSKIDLDIEKNIYDILPNYRKALDLPDKDPLLQEINSPFI